MIRTRPAPPPAARSPLSARRAALVLLLAPVLLAGCAGSDDDVATDEPTVRATTAPPATTPSASPTPSATPDDAQVVSINVSGGQVTGAEPRTVIALGTRVRLTITSDAADEVHVHGYELTEQLPAGQAVNIEFVADRPGIYEVELHDAGTLLTRLQVQ